MLTVKISTPQCERVVEAKNVLFDRSKQSNDSLGHIAIDMEDGIINYEVRAATPDGEGPSIIYVMNRQGATVATYYF